jgi:hypothetical protein
VPVLSLSDVNYLAHRFRLNQQSDVSSHFSDSTDRLSSYKYFASLFINDEFDRYLEFL